jgi:C1A family cysteine protease
MALKTLSKAKNYNPKYGWRPDKPDFRDFKFTGHISAAALPSFVDLRSKFPAIYNQQQLGSCTANSIAGIVEFDLIRQKLLFAGSTSYMPSRLFIYYNERVMEGTVDQDAGAEIRDGIKSINVQGVCAESEWPYNVNAFATKPPTACFTNALKNKSVYYQSINQDLADMQSCLAGGFPFSFGFTVYDSFESDAVAATGIVPMPQATESVLGGHAVAAVGYNSDTSTVNGVPAQTFIVRNSWGPYWGVNGYCFMPFVYLSNQNLSSDFWKITVMV